MFFGESVNVFGVVIIERRVRLLNNIPFYLNEDRTAKVLKMTSLRTYAITM
ncbi:hypothetical protein JCM19047_3829 [Bacillus sp. JCM 19047]|nr:hypothetical protein JCM19047_3829 [Bacillus sp. JCM 19047]